MDILLIRLNLMYNALRATLIHDGVIDPKAVPNRSEILTIAHTRIEAEKVGNGNSLNDEQTAAAAVENVRGAMEEIKLEEWYPQDQSKLPKLAFENAEFQVYHLN